MGDLRTECLKLRVDQGSKLDSLLATLEDVRINLDSPYHKNRSKKSSSQAFDINDDIGLDSLLRENTKIKLDPDDIRQLSDDIANLAITDRRLALVAKEQAFLRSLDFPSRAHRSNDISAAHEESFGWILDGAEGQASSSPPEEAKHPSFREWLRSGDGIFWISGKAGSGKSTLMKWLMDQEPLLREVKHWAGSRKGAVAAHYFWAAGSEMQKSQKGLIQALLYQALGACPELIPEICSTRWAATSLCDSENSKDWPLRELFGVFRALATRDNLPVRFCFLIDGADEYDGDHFELCAFLKDISTSKNLKLCISSRPWNVFEDAFGALAFRKIYIHDLTRQDILSYVQCELSRHSQWGEPYFTAEQMRFIVNTVTDRATGVFLWVFLAVRSLRKGLVNGDTFFDLQRQLERLPTDLEPFFKHMLDIVGDDYSEHMGRLLRIATNAKRSLHLQFYHMQENELADVDYALHMPIEAYTPGEIQARLAQCGRRINARCGGLLEIKEGRVEFLHRTVRDFLLTKDMNEYLERKSGHDFRVNVSTLRGFVFLFRAWMQTTDWLPLAEDQEFWTEGLEYANDAIRESPESATALLSAVEDIYIDMPGTREADFLDVQPDYVFRSELLRAGVSRYISSKLIGDPDYFDSVFESPLCTIIEQPSWTKGHLDSITAFLEAGDDVNAGDERSPWCRLIQRTVVGGDFNSLRLATEHLLFSHFLRAGARRDARVPRGDGFFGPIIQMSDEDESATQLPRILLPCTRVISCMMTSPTSYQFSRQCLGTLDEFFSTETSEVISQLSEIRDVLKSQLAQVARQKMTPGRLRFLAQVLQVVVRKADHIKFDMETLFSDIRESFSDREAAVLLDLIPAKGEPGCIGLNKSCRKRPLSSRAGTETKKQKMG